MNPLDAGNRFHHKTDKHAPEGKKKADKVAQLGGQAIPKMGFMDKLLVRGGLYAASKIVGSDLEKKEEAARAYLQDHIRGVDVITKGLPKELEVIIQFLQQSGLPINQDNQPGDGASRDKKLINSVVWIALGNVAKKVTKEGEKISLEDFTYRATQYFVPFIGERLNRIDEKIAEGAACDAATFTPFVKDLFDSVLQLEGKLEKMGLKVLQGVLAGLIADQYKQTKTLIQTGVSVPGKDKTVILPFLKKVSTYFATVVSDKSVKADQKKLVEITKHSAEEINQFLAPVIKHLEPLVGSLIEDSLQDYLPKDPELAGQLTSAIAHKLLLNLCESYKNSHPGQPARLELIVLDLQKRFQQVSQGGEQEMHNLSDFLLRSLVLNDVPFLTGYYGRYQDNAQKLVESFLDPLFKLVKSSDQMLVDAELVLGKKVKTNPSMIEAVDHMIGKVAGMGSGFVLPYHSKENLFAAPKVVNEILKSPLEKGMRAFLWKIFVRMVPTPPDGKLLKAEELLPSIFDNFVQFANAHFPDLNEKVKKEWKGLSAEERKIEALKLNEPILKAFLKQFISDDLSAEIPLPEKYRQAIVEKIESSLNDMIADGLVATYGWMLEKQDNEEALNRMFKSKDDKPGQPSAPVKACHAAGKIVQAALPYQCREKGNEWAQSVFEILKADLPAGEPSQKIASEGKKLVASLFSYVGIAQSQEVKDVLSFVSTYAETALLKLSRQLGERVENLDHALVEGDSSTMEKILGMFMKELEPHLRVYGENRKLFRKDDKQKILEAFEREGLLHAGLGDATDRDIVFKSWSAKILALAGLQAGAPIPVPSLFRDEAWRALQDTLLPSLLVTAFDKMKDPHMMDKVIRIGLEKLSADWNKDKVAADHIREAFFPAATADYKAKSPKVREFDDPYQEDLEGKVGQLGRLLLKLHSSPVIGSVMRMKWARKRLGEAVGQPLRRNLRTPTDQPNKPGKAVSLNEVLGASLGAFVDHFVPCERVGDKWNYFAMDEEGIVTNTILEEPDFTELFPTNQEEKERLHVRDVVRRAVLERQVIKGTRRVIRDQLNMQLQSLMNAPWDSFVNGFVRMMRAIALSKHKDKVELGVRKFFWFLRRYVVFPVLALITFPLWLTVREILNTIFTQKGKKHIEGLKHDIHTNLAYRFVDQLLHKLEEDLRRKEAQVKKPRHV
jgi:hypothetical protein